MSVYKYRGDSENIDVTKNDSPKFSLQFSHTRKLLQISVDRLQTAIFIAKLELVTG